CYNPVNDASNPKKPTLTLNTANNRIECGVLGKTVSAVPAICDVDIVLTLPTNHAACTATNDNGGTLVAPNGSTISSTPIVQIAKAYAKFLRENFLHTRGAAVALVPYSAKISVPPDKSAWTVAIPPMNQLPAELYLKQALVYGTDGHFGGEIVSDPTDIQYDWGDEDLNTGFPIMFRKEGNLLSTENPNSDSLKFQRMNPNPCSVQSCNLLAGCCEANCPTSQANPYFITQLTDDVGSVIYNLRLIHPINDPENRSNFLFLAVQWAQMLLFETWTDHPAAAAVANQKFIHPARGSKKKAIIFVVNSPDRFDSRGPTYLGFSNDASEVDKIASDTLNFGTDFGDGIKQSSPNGLLTFTTTSGSVIRRNNYYECPNSTAVTGKLAFPNKYLVKLTIARGSDTTTVNVPTETTISAGAVEWVAVGSNKADDAYSSFGNWSGLCAIGDTIYTIDFSNGQLVYLNTAAATKTWTPIGSNTAANVYLGFWTGLHAIGNIIYAINFVFGQLAYLDTTATTKTWTTIGSNTAEDVYPGYWYGLWAIGGILYAIEKDFGQLVCLNTAAATKAWTVIGSNTTEDVCSGSWHGLCAIRGTLYAIEYDSGQLVYLNTAAATKTWAAIGSNRADDAYSGSWYDLCAIGNIIYAIEDTGQLVCLNTTAATKTWTTIGSNKADDVCSGSWRGLCAIGNIIYAIEYNSGQLVCLDTAPPDVTAVVDVPTTVKLPSSITIAGNTHSITGQTDIYVQPSQMSANEISFTMTNIQLKSAMITNQPYSVSGSTVTLTIPRTLDTTAANTALLARKGATSATYPHGWHRNATGDIITPTDAVKNVTADACTKLAAAVGSNTMVYVIKYKTTDTSLDSCVATGKIKTYSADSEEDLNEKLREIAADIKSFAGYSAPQMAEI
ncbi:MAG: hypothetical protein LBJ96_04635, partial [Holosporaceae bacterium]|nr:hypothetical protein [Holosporaceae bacterium]